MNIHRPGRWMFTLRSLFLRLQRGSEASNSCCLRCGTCPVNMPAVLAFPLVVCDMPEQINAGLLLSSVLVMMIKTTGNPGDEHHDAVHGVRYSAGHLFHPGFGESFCYHCCDGRIGFPFNQCHFYSPPSLCSFFFSAVHVLMPAPVYTQQRKRIAVIADPKSGFVGFS